MTPLTARTALAALTAALLPLAAAAQQPAPQPGGGATTPSSTPEIAFMRADANSDGKLSKAEASRLPAVAQKFEALDKDKDGSLSMAEYMAAFEPSPKQ